jgi:hypothetical protein
MQTSNFNISYFFFTATLPTLNSTISYPGANDKLALSPCTLDSHQFRVDGDILHAQSRRLVCFKLRHKAASPNSFRQKRGWGDVIGARRKQLPTRLLRARLTAHPIFTLFPRRLRRNGPMCKNTYGRTYGGSAWFFHLIFFPLTFSRE